MGNGAHINTLLQMTIGQINDLEKTQKETNDKWNNIIDRQKETVASFIEQNKIEEVWANKFLEDLDNGN